jgi:hypothetical protein
MDIYDLQNYRASLNDEELEKKIQNDLQNY